MYLYDCFIYFCNTLFIIGALQIRNSEEKDHGKYECVAENAIGTDYSKSGLLYVKGRKEGGLFFVLSWKCFTMLNFIRETVRYVVLNYTLRRFSSSSASTILDSTTTNQ